MVNLRPAVASSPGEDFGSELVARVFMRKKQGENQRSSAKPVLFTLDLLRPLFHLSLQAAAVRVHLCPTALKSVCRKLGLKGWPFKQYRDTIGKSSSQLPPSLRSATESESSCSPPLAPRPSLAELLLELPLPGDDASNSRAFDECFSDEFAPFPASTESPPLETPKPKP